MLTVIPRHGELYIVNANPRGWWLECWTPTEGHSEASWEYYRSTRPPAADCDLVARWAKCPPANTPFQVRKHLTPPRNLRYIGA